MESPAAMRIGPVLAKVPLTVTEPLAGPPGPEMAPAGAVLAPPAPAVSRAVVRLAALPVSPEIEPERDWAPELALEPAAPRAEASPVSPESPESPEELGRASC